MEHKRQFGPGPASKRRQRQPTQGSKLGPEFNRRALAGRINDAVQGKKVTVLAKQIGVSASAVYDWAAGRSVPPLERLDHLAALTDVDFCWLAVGRGSKRRDMLPEGYVRIQSFAGGRERELDYLALKAEWVRGLPGAPKPEALFLSSADDDSMAPTIKVDDIVVINTLDREVRSGLFALVPAYEEKKLVLRRVHPNPDGTVELLCDNAKYPRARVDEVQVFGRVIWVGGLV